MAQATERDRLLATLGMLTGDRVMSPMGKELMRRAEVEAESQAKLAQQTYDRGQDTFRNDLALRRLTQDQQQAEASRQDRLLSASDRVQAARDRASALQADRDSRATDRDATTRDRALERLTKLLDSGGYSELHQSLGSLNNLMSQYPKGKNIPGIGGAANVDKMGIGTAITHLPGGGGAEARNNQSTASAVRNAILKARSGGAVTTGEADRLLNELSQGLFASDADFRAAISRINAVLNAKIRNVMAGYPADVVTEYYSRGGQVRELDPGMPGKSGFSATPIP